MTFNKKQIKDNYIMLRINSKDKEFLNLLASKEGKNLTQFIFSAIEFYIKSVN